MVFWFRGSPSIFISMETTAAFGVDDSRSSFCAWKLESSKVSLEWGNFEVFQKTLRGEKLDVFGKLSKAMQISPDNPSLGRVFQMRTLMCSSKALPTQHSFVRNKKGQVRAYGLHMASCGSLFGYIFCELCFRLHKISWTKSSGLFHKYWRDLKEFYVLFWLVWSGQETTKHSLDSCPGHHCGWVGYPNLRQTVNLEWQEWVSFHSWNPTHLFKREENIHFEALKQPWKFQESGTKPICYDALSVGPLNNTWLSSDSNFMLNIVYRELYPVISESSNLYLRILATWNSSQGTADHRWGGSFSSIGGDPIRRTWWPLYQNPEGEKNK